MRHQFFIQTLVVGLTLAIVPNAWADLQWLNGASPKNAPETQAGNVVTDAPGSPSAPAPASNQEVVVSHMITCSKIVNSYPADSVNYFYLDKNSQINYYAYFLIKPSSHIHTATVEIYNPMGFKILKHDQEFAVGFTDRLLTVENTTYQWFLVTTTMDINNLNSENGQLGLPKDVGLYTVHLIVDNQLVGITFFYVKAQAPKAPEPISPLAPAAKPSAGNASPSAPSSPSSITIPGFNPHPIEAIPGAIQ
jgi:hypothetical protein